jgi:hypothetical protein
LVTGQVGVDELDETVEILGGDLQRILAPRSRAFPLVGGCSPIRSSGQSSRHICRGSQQTARSRWQSPCTSLPRGERAGGTRGRVCRHGIASVVG